MHVSGDMNNYGVAQSALCVYLLCVHLSSESTAVIANVTLNSHGTVKPK